ncbi:hypothetical protein ACHAXN_000175, partial [Cyclotella atomus]
PSSLPAGFRHKWPCLPPRQNTSLSARLFATSSRLWSCLTRCGVKATKSCATSRSFTARCSRTTPVPSNSLVCPSFVLERNTLTRATITFVSTYGKVSSRSFPSAPMIKLLTL